MVKVTLKDHQVLRGRLVGRSADTVSIELGEGGVSQFPISSVEQVDEDRTSTVRDGQLWPADPNRTRYFVTPSAMMLRRGELSFSQKELLFTTFSYGVTDWLSVQAGSVLPMLFINNGANFIGAVKVGHSIGERFHLAGGTQALVLPSVTSSSGPMGAGVVFVTGTYGTSDLHVSLSAGKPIFLSQTSALSGPLLFTGSLNARLARSAALISETWVMPSFEGPGFFIASAAGVRLMGDHFAVDLGLVELGTERGSATNLVPLPWLDFTYNF